MKDSYTFACDVCGVDLRDQNYFHGPDEMDRCMKCFGVPVKPDAPTFEHEAFPVNDTNRNTFDERFMDEFKRQSERLSEATQEEVRRWFEEHYEARSKARYVSLGNILCVLTVSAFIAAVIVLTLKALS